jgi:hypothetical protein
MDPLALELELDRVIARLEAAIAEHTAAWAATGVAPPGPAGLASAGARAVLGHAIGGGGALAARARPYLEACRRAAVEADPDVARQRAEDPTWAGLGPLAEARAAAAWRIGWWPQDDDAAADDVAAPVPPRAPAFHQPGDLAPVSIAALGRALDALAAIHGGDPARVRLRLGDAARCFVVAPGRDVRITVRPGATPARWAEALHELGHALLALRPGPRPARAADEGAAAFVARHLERPAFSADVLGLAPGPAEALARVAAAARDRQVGQRRVLAALDGRGGDADRRRCELAAAAAWPELAGRARPPVALWHDPGAHRAYRDADPIADRLERRLGAGWPGAPLPDPIDDAGA